MATNVVDLNSLPTKRPILRDYATQFWAMQLSRKNFMRTQIPNRIRNKDGAVVTLEQIDFRNNPTFEMLSIKQTMYKLIINYVVKLIFKFPEKDKLSIENRANQLLDVFNIRDFTRDQVIKPKVMAMYLKFHEYVYRGGHNEDLKVNLQFYVIKMIFELKANKNSETFFFSAEKEKLIELLKQLFSQRDDYGENLNVFCQFFVKQEAQVLFPQASAAFIDYCPTSITPRRLVTLSNKGKDSWEHMIFRRKKVNDEYVMELSVDRVCQFLSGSLPKWTELPDFEKTLEELVPFLPLGKQQTKNFQQPLLSTYFVADCFATKYARTDLMFFELACSKFSPSKVIFACRDEEIDAEACKPNNAMLLDFMENHVFDTPDEEDFTDEEAKPGEEGEAVPEEEGFTDEEAKPEEEGKAARGGGFAATASKAGLKIDNCTIKKMYQTWQQETCNPYFMRKEEEILRMLQFQLGVWLTDFSSFQNELNITINNRLEKLTADIESFKAMETSTFTGATTGFMDYDLTVFPFVGKIITIDIANKFALQPIELFFSLYSENSGKPHQMDMWKLKAINPGSPIVINCVSDDGNKTKFRVNAQVLTTHPTDTKKTFVVVTGITNVKKDETEKTYHETDSKQDANTFPNDKGLKLTRQTVEVEYDTDALIKTRLVKFCASIKEKLNKDDIKSRVNAYLQQLVRLKRLDGGKERKDLAKFLPREYQNAFNSYYSQNQLVPVYVADLKFWETETQQKGYSITKFDDDFLKALDLYGVNLQAQTFLAVSRNITTLTVATDWANLWLNTFDKLNPETKIVFPGVEPAYKMELYDEMFPIQPTLSNLELLFDSENQFFNSGQVHLILLFEIDGTIDRPIDEGVENEFTGTTKVEKGLLPTFQQVLTANAPRQVGGTSVIPQFGSVPDETLKSIALKILKEKLEDKRATQKGATDFTELFTELKLTKLLGKEQLDKINLVGLYSTKFVNSLMLFHARWNKLEPSSTATRPTDEASLTDEDSGSDGFSTDEERIPSVPANTEGDAAEEYSNEFEEGFGFGGDDLFAEDDEAAAAGGSKARYPYWADDLFAEDDKAAARDKYPHLAGTDLNPAKRGRGAESPQEASKPKRVPKLGGGGGPATDESWEDKGADPENPAVVVSKGVPSRVIEPLMLFVCMKENKSLDGMMSNDEVARLREVTKIGPHSMYDIFYSEFFNNVEIEEEPEPEPEPEARKAAKAKKKDVDTAKNDLFSKLRADKVFSQFFVFFKKLDNAMTDFIQTYPVQAYKYFNIMNTLICSFGLEFFLRDNVVDLFPPEMDPIENSGAFLWTIMFSSFFDFGIENPSYFNRESTFSSKDVSDLYEYASDKGGKHGFGAEFDDKLNIFLKAANETLLYEANFFNVMDVYYTTPQNYKEDSDVEIEKYMSGRKEFPVSIHGESEWKFGEDPDFATDDFRTASDAFQIQLNRLKASLMETQKAEYKKILGGISSANKDGISSIRIATLADDKPRLLKLFERQESFRNAFDTLSIYSFKDLEHKSKLEESPPTAKEKVEIERERKTQEKEKQKLERGEDVELRTSQMFKKDVWFKTTQRAGVIKKDIFFKFTDGAEKVKRWHLGDAMWPDCTPRNLAKYLELTRQERDQVLDNFISMGLENAPLGKIIASEILFYLSRGPVGGVFQTFKYLVKKNHYELHPYNSPEWETRIFKLKGYGNQPLSWNDEQKCYILNKAVYVIEAGEKRTIEEADLVRFGATPDIGLFFAQEEWERLQQSGQNVGKTDTEYRMQQMKERDREIRDLFAQGRSFEDPEVEKRQDKVLKIQQKLKISNEFMFLLCDPVIKKFSSLVDIDDLREQILAQALLLSKRFKEEKPILSSVDTEADFEMGVVPYNKYRHFDVAQNSMFHAVNEIFEFFKARKELSQTLQKEHKKLQQFLEAFGVLFDEYEYTETEFEGNDKLFKDRLNLAMNLPNGRIFRETAKMQVFQRRYKLLKGEFEKCVIVPEPDEEYLGFEDEGPATPEDPSQVIDEIVNKFYKDQGTIALCVEIEETRQLTLDNFTPEALDNSYDDILMVFYETKPLLRNAIAAYSKFKQMKMIYVKAVLYRDYPKFRHIFDTKEVISVSILKVARDCFVLSDKSKEKFRKSIAQYSRVAKEMIVFQKKTVAYKKELEDAFDSNKDYETGKNLDNVKAAIVTNFQLRPSRLSKQALKLLNSEDGTDTQRVYEDALRLSFFETTKMVQFLEMNDPQELRRSPTPSPPKGAVSPGSALNAKHKKDAKEIAMNISLRQTNTQDALRYYRKKEIGDLEALYDQLSLVDLEAIFKKLDIDFNKSSTKEQLQSQLSEECFKDNNTATESRFVV